MRRRVLLFTFLFIAGVAIRYYFVPEFSLWSDVFVSAGVALVIVLTESFVLQWLTGLVKKVPRSNDD